MTSVRLNPVFPLVNMVHIPQLYVASLLFMNLVYVINSAHFQTGADAIFPFVTSEKQCKLIKKYLNIMVGGVMLNCCIV